MKFYKRDIFSFFELDECVVCFIPDKDIEKLAENTEIISNFTNETFQKDRSKTERLLNTKQGKIAETIFEEVIEIGNFTRNINDRLIYTTYDSFRIDNFEKHAPFDGLLYNKFNSEFENIKKLIINETMLPNYMGKISSTLLQKCKENKIYAVEIKSSQIPKKILSSCCNNSDFRKTKNQKKIIAELLKLDYIKYPYFDRTDGDTIQNFNFYIDFVKRLHPYILDEKQLIQIEISNSSHIYTRIFVEKSATTSFIAYIFGYVLADEFYKQPKLAPLFQAGKTEKAMYMLTQISKAKKIWSLFDDERLWKI